MLILHQVQEAQEGSKERTRKAARWRTQAAQINRSPTLTSSTTSEKSESCSMIKKTCGKSSWVWSSINWHRPNTKASRSWNRKNSTTSITVFRSSKTKWCQNCAAKETSGLTSYFLKNSNETRCKQYSTWASSKRSARLSRLRSTQTTRCDKLWRYSYKVRNDENYQSVLSRLAQQTPRQNAIQTDATRHSRRVFVGLGCWQPRRQRRQIQSGSTRTRWRLRVSRKGNPVHLHIDNQRTQTQNEEAQFKAQHILALHQSRLHDIFQRVFQLLLFDTDRRQEIHQRRRRRLW